MQISDLPRSIKKVWASVAGSSYVRSVPDTGSTGGAAAYDVGFPPATFQPIASGGTPPDGRDVNGALMDLSAWARWSKAGGSVLFDADFANAVGGYPAYAIVASTTSGKLWQSTADNNTTNPDSAQAQNWVTVSASFGTDANSIVYPDGKIDQWGLVTYPSNVETVVSVTLAKPYTTGAYNICVTPMINAGSNNADIWVQAISGSINNKGFSVQYQRGYPNDQPHLDGFFWRTIGK